MSKRQSRNNGQPQKPAPLPKPASSPEPAPLPKPQIDQRLIGVEHRNNDGANITRKVISPPEKKEK